MAEKKFVDGLIVKRNEKAPSFVVCSLSFKSGDFVKFIGENAVKGWLNVDIKLSREGKYYSEVNNWTKENAKPKVEEEEDNQSKLNNLDRNGSDAPMETIDYPEDDINPEDIPF
jgi:hypothetical protein